MDERYKQFLIDLAAFIRFAHKHNKPDAWTLGNIAHDVNGVNEHGLDTWFSPRCTGYAHDETCQARADAN